MNYNIKLKRFWLEVTLPYKSGSVTYRYWYQQGSSFPGWRLERKSDGRFSSSKVDRVCLSLLQGNKTKIKIRKAKFASHRNDLVIDKISY